MTGTPIVNRGVRKLPNHLDLAAAALLRSRRIRISGSGAGSFSLANLAAQIPGYLQRAFRGRRRLSGAEGEVPLPPLKERTPGRGGTRQGTLRQLVNGRAVRPPTAA